MSDPLAVLGRIRAQPNRPPPRPGECCDMCAEPIADEHGHVVDLENRSLMCTCRGCYLLFSSRGAGGGHYRAVPDRYRVLTDFALSGAQWDALQIPVSVAFFFMNSTLGDVAAFYPGPAGATESLLALNVWNEVVAANPPLATLEPDVEAVLVRADPKGETAPACFVVPIDSCYELVGELRRLWRGFDGGREANDALDAFFARVEGARAMTGLHFEVIDAYAERYAAVPTLNLRLRITETDDVPLHAIALRCQIRIEPQKRRYDGVADDQLAELFGDRTRWGETLRPFQWTNVATVVGGFRGATDVDLPVVCTYDLEVAASKYFNALADGEIPLLLLFSGTTFTQTAAGGGFGPQPIAWHEEAAYRLPVRVWRDMMDLYFPNSGWVRVSRETLDALTRFKAVHALPTWDLAFEQLLKEAGEG